MRSGHVSPVRSDVEQRQPQSRQPSPRHQAPRTIARRDNEARAAQRAQMTADRRSTDARPPYNRFARRTALPNETSENRQATRMRKRPQRFKHVLRLASVCQFAAHGFQNRTRVFDQRIGLSKIPDPSSIAPGRKQAPRLERTQIDTGLILGHPSLLSDSADRQPRRFRHNRQARQPPFVHQCPAGPPYRRVVNFRSTSHEMWTAYHPVKGASNPISVCSLLMRCGYGCRRETASASSKKGTCFRWPLNSIASPHDSEERHTLTRSARPWRNGLAPNNLSRWPRL